MKIEQIVVGTDLSRSGRRAVQLAASTARATGASLSLVHACETGVDYAWPEFPVGIRPAVRALRERFEIQLRDSTEALREERALCEARGVQCDYTLGEGSPWETLLSAAGASANLIVVGAHKETRALPVPLLGSTAERVVRHAPCSVLVACGRLREDYDGAHLLVGVDFSDHAISSIRWAKELAIILRAKITLLHVIPHPITQRALPKEWGPVRQAMKRAAATRLSELVVDQGLNAQTAIVVHDGQVGPELCNLASQLEADLVVVGTRGQSRLRDLMIGGTSHYCLRYSPVPVLAARP